MKKQTQEGQQETCPQCGKALGKDDQILICAGCGNYASTGCCLTSGAGGECDECIRDTIGERPFTGAGLYGRNRRP